MRPFTTSREHLGLPPVQEAEEPTANQIQTVYLAASLVIGVMVAAMLRRSAQSERSRRQLAVSSTGLILALLCVGVVSHTFVRHIVQSAPIVVALLLVMRRSSYGTIAAAPIFTFWLGIMLNIWMFLLGIARIFTGTFTPIEIILTVIMAGVCSLGVVTIGRAGSHLSLGRRLGAAVVFAFLQFGALVASFQPLFRR